jgi:hypothetical protein
MKTRIGILIAVAVTLVAGAAAALIYFMWFSDWPGGMRPIYHAIDHDRRLTQAAKSALPVRDAVKRYFGAHAAYPVNIAAFQNDLPGISQLTPEGGVDGWTYSPATDGKGFSLRRRLGWDPALEYRWDGSIETWVFDPGDGSPMKMILLQP